MFKWDKVFKSGLSKFCGRQPLKNLLIPLLNTLSRMIVEKVRTLRKHNDVSYTFLLS